MVSINNSIENIDAKLRLVRESCLYNEGLTNTIMRALNQDSISHSDAIETDSSSVLTLERLQNAWSYAVRQPTGQLTHRFVKYIGNLVEPNNAGYRTGSVRLIDYDDDIQSRCNPCTVEREMGKLLNHINEGNSSPILQAAEFSLYGLFIHPLSDGNGRTFRLLHNIILYNNKIPPVVIREAERRSYKMLVGNAFKGFRDRDGKQDMFETHRSPGEMEYFGFMVDKVQESVDAVTKKYAKFRKYGIDCYIRGNGKRLRGLRDVLRRQTAAGGWVFSSTTDAESSTVTIVTDAPIGFLEASLCNYSRNKDWFKGYDLNQLK